MKKTTPYDQYPDLYTIKLRDFTGLEVELQFPRRDVPHMDLMEMIRKHEPDSLEMDQEYLMQQIAQTWSNWSLTETLRHAIVRER